jgi:cytoskeletal protein CcmA (bactofilin family)
MKPSATSNPPSNGTKEFGETCVISAGSNMEGMFSSSENVRLDGFVKGEIKCSQRFVMGENGRVEGNLYSNDAIIMGRIDGDVIVTDTLQLKSTGIIKGSITAKYMIVEEGAQYVGECKIGS